MKVDFKKTLSAYKAKKNKIDLVTVPTMQYLMIDGAGIPKGENFNNKIKTIYPLAYAIKFYSKNKLGRDYVVPPMEGLWWAEDMQYFTDKRDKSKWSWTIMLMVPEWIKDLDYNKIKKEVEEKKNLDLSALRLETLEEGICAQVLHVGPFDDEGVILKEMHEQFIPDNGYAMTGKHHEIYLSDVRRVDPSKYRTILRQPIKKK